MQPSLEKLRKFFRLEHENKYVNTAIIGGLAKMLDFWEGEARADGVAEEVIQAVVARLRSYEKLSPDGRAESLKGLWKRIGETYPEAGQKPKTQTQPPQKQNQPPRPPRAAQVSTPTNAEAPVLPSQRPENQPQPQVQQKPRQAVAPRSESVPGAKTSQTPAALNAELTVLQGVGPKHAETLTNLGMKTLGDMLYYFLTAANPKPLGPRCVPITAVAFTNRTSRGTDWGTRAIISFSNFRARCSAFVCMMARR